MVTMETIADTPAELARPEHYDVIVIGAGQAGLSMGYYLKRQGRRFVILDERKRVGDVWRSRWDSLRLFSPARYDGLPGMPFPASRYTFPTRDEVADYFEAYVERMTLPVRNGVRVDGLWPAADGQDGFVVTAGDRRFEADQVVVSTGAEERPWMPAFADELAPGIRQVHSSAYRNPSQFQDGDVLVVGAGNSGAEIAMEAAREHHTILAGRDVGSVPFRIDRPIAKVALPVLWFVANHILTFNTPAGRKVGPLIRSGHGGPLVRVKPADLAAAGVERTTERMTGVRNGKPVLGEGRVVDVANVVWCTGFRSEFGWIHLPAFDERGYPRHVRGVIADVPGLYFLGLPFLHAFGSMLLGGVGRDAAYLARKIAATSRVG